MIRTYEMDVPARKKILYDISDLIRSGDMYGKQEQNWTRRMWSS